MKFNEKMKLLRKANDLTQAEFAQAIGISRGNLSGLELGKVKPTQVLINYLSLMFSIDKEKLINDNDNDNDFWVFAHSASMLSSILEKYTQLTPIHRKFVEKQINDLLLMQESTCK